MKVLLHRLDGVHDRLGVGIEVFVHRRSDHDNQTLCGLNGARLAAGGDAPGCQRPLQHLLGACLPMGHASRADGLNRSGIRVEQRDAQPGVGQSQAKGKSDMATSPENDDVPRPVSPHLEYVTDPPSGDQSRRFGVRTGPP